MKLAIIGSRTCPPLDIEAQLKYIPDTIISGGADTYAREFAKKHNLNLIEYLPEYDKYPPKIAPLIRNRQKPAICFVGWLGVELYVTCKK